MQSGRDQLRAWVLRRFDNQREAAAFLGLHESDLSKILSGARSVGLGRAVAIHEKTGIPVEAWVSDKEDATDAVDAISARNSH